MIVCPNTSIHPDTLASLNEHAPGGWESIRLDTQDPSAYFWALHRLWAQPGDLVIVEHDNALTAEVLPGFEACEQWWCGHPYACAGNVTMALGCTRFRAELKQAEPDLLDEVGGIGNDGLPARDWRRLDVRILTVLNRRGYQWHWHEPQVPHFHVYPPPLPWPPR